MARYKLDVDPDPEVILIGISSHVNDYRLCWALNQALGINLARRESDITGQGPERMASFSAFDHVDPGTEARYLLVNNHSGEGVLMKEHRHVDYFLVVDQRAPITTGELIDLVRGTEFVLTAFALDARNERSAHKLLQ